MPNKHAAIKALRQNKKRALKNHRLKTHARALMGQLEKLAKEGKKTEMLTLMPKLQQAMDKGAKNQVFHKNKARHAVSFAHRALAKIK